MENHAISNARGWAQIICDAMAAYQALEAGEESATYDGDTFDNADDLRQRIEELPLSVQVRDGWYSPGTESTGPDEFEILLSIGGPALRIYGDFYGSLSLQWQDWGTLWTDYRDITEEQEKAIAAFVELFWLGE